MKQKHVCILYPYNYLPYSPTVLNLYDELSRQFQVTIVCVNRHSQNEGGLDSRNIVQVSYEREALYKATRKLLRLLRLLGAPTPNSDVSLERYLQFRATKRTIAKLKPDHVVAVDIIMLWIAQRILRRPVHLLSLELKSMKGIARVDQDLVDSVVIESRKRLTHIFGERAVRAFFVPVSPIYKPIKKPRTNKKSLLYCGSATGPFGIYTCLHFLSRYPEFVLTTRGRMDQGTFQNIVMCYPRLLDENRLTIESTYLPEEAMLDYISKFRIGFCFYDTRFDKIANFHFFNVTSQKLYRYFTGGVPVVANRLDGLKAVEEFEAGVLIEDMTPESILEAIGRIEQDYDRYVENCFTAAKDLSFDRHVQPFVEYLDR